MTEAEHEDAKRNIDTLREWVREDLAEDLGGNPEDYHSSKPVVPGGGDGSAEPHSDK